MMISNFRIRFTRKYSMNMMTFLSKEDLPDEKYFINHNSKKVSSAVIDLLTSPYELSDNWELVARIEVIKETQRLKEAVVNSLLSFKAKKIEQLIAESQLEIKKAGRGRSMRKYLNL